MRLVIALLIACFGFAVCVTGVIKSISKYNICVENTDQKKYVSFCKKTEED